MTIMDPHGCTTDKRKCDRLDEDIEYLLYHGFPYELCEDIAHAASLRKPRGVNALTAGDGNLILYAIVEEIHVIAFGFTDLHVAELRTHLKENLFKLMLTEVRKFTSQS